jgi:hypothetical protein
LFEPGQVCIGIFLDHYSEDNDGKSVIMVLAQKGEVYERIGLGRLSGYKRFDKNEKEVVTGKYDSSGYKVYGLELNPPTLSKSWKEVRLG